MTTDPACEGCRQPGATIYSPYGSTSRIGFWHRRCYLKAAARDHARKLLVRSLEGIGAMGAHAPVLAAQAVDACFGIADGILAATIKTLSSVAAAIEAIDQDHHR
jgi:hypothetical protein